jgi:16S rRNA A1518/A1519 N6-dimethyltransferase RsmA/KsgA/DIM1 with predicted DNA glycosylase/AP lyase activity
VLADTSKRKYSSLSVEHALRADALREAFVVPAIAFTPPPRRTKTSVLVIDFAEEAPVTPAEGRILRASLQSAFKEKGQTLRDSLWRSRELRGLVPSLRALCDDADFNWLDKRPSELAVGKWLHVARSLESVAAAMAATSQEAEAGAGKIAEE